MKKKEYMKPEPTEYDNLKVMTKDVSNSEI